MKGGCLRLIALTIQGNRASLPACGWELKGHSGLVAVRQQALCLSLFSKVTPGPEHSGQSSQNRRGLLHHEVERQHTAIASTPKASDICCSDSTVMDWTHSMQKWTTTNGRNTCLTKAKTLGMWTYSPD